MVVSETSQVDVEEASLRRDARFFQPNLPQNRIPAAFAELLEHYSCIPRDKQASHILTVRNQAYKSHPYPCLGRFRFLDLDLATHPLYQSYVLPQLKAGPEKLDDATTTTSPGPIFLDLGTCLAQDIRKLIYDGAAAEYLYGADLDTTFVDIGYALFKDHDKLPKSHFLTGPGCNVIADPDEGNDPAEAGLKQFDNQTDIINATAIFHLFDRESQKKLARRCLRLLRKPTSDSSTDSNIRERRLILGGQAGNIDAGDSVRHNGQKRFRHNEESWRKMWDEVADEPEWKARDTKIDVKSRLVERNFFKHVDQAQESEPPEPQEPLAQGDGKTEWNSKVVGAEEDGHRWHVYSIWVEFGK